MGVLNIVFRLGGLLALVAVFSFGVWGSMATRDPSMAMESSPEDFAHLMAASKVDSSANAAERERQYDQAYAEALELHARSEQHVADKKARRALLREERAERELDKDRGSLSEDWGGEQGSSDRYEDGWAY